MIRFLSAACVLAVSLMFASVAQAVPIPRYQSYITDYAGIMEAEHHQKLARFISVLKQKTGAEVAVLTMNDLEDDTIEDFAERTFNTWKIGQAGKDNGVLLLVAIKQRQARIEVGYGLEDVLTDGICGVILDKMVPFFKGEWYSQGIYAGTVAIINQIAQANDVTISEFPKVSTIKDPNAGEGFFAWLIKTIFFLFFMMIVLSSRFGLLHYFLFGSMMRSGYWSHGQRGGFGGSGFGGGFGGFGGGSSGGGGASRSW